MITWASIFLWALSILAVSRLLCIVCRKSASGKTQIFCWAFVVLAAVLLLFRPHEDIFGGEDPGSYLNSGVTYGRKLSFSYVDPMLVQVPVEQRPLFYYGHAGFGTTKDACLWVKDTEAAVVGANFQPSYPLLISLVTRLAGPYAGLYVIPLFTIFAALALAALASQCTEHRWVGIAAFTFFILNPLVIWHGRCPRPEIIAAFLFFGGSALLLHAWNGKAWARWYDIVIGALCIGFAPMFHITASLLVIPAACVIACVAPANRKDFFLAPAAALLPATAFIYQATHVTSYYRTDYLLTFPLRHPVFSVGVLVVYLLSAAGISAAAKRSVNRKKTGISLFLAAAFACVTIAFFVVSYITRDAIGSLPILGRPVYHYLYLTDFQAFANMVSRPVTFLLLAGWAAWITGRSEHRLARIVIALAVLPGMMLSGQINDFMMTRYFLVTLLPVSALVMASLVTLPRERGFFSVLPLFLAIVIGFTGLYRRTHLITLTEHKGFTRFIESFARTIIEENGLLLGEYSRIAAPFEHFFGIPTLAIDNGQKDDYTEQKKAWARIMTNNPENAAFFITPFQEPLSDLFDFELVRHEVFSGQSLQQAYNYLPTVLRRGQLPLSMYRMTLKPDTPTRAAQAGPGVIRMDAGNMGVKRFANVRIRSRSVYGFEWESGKTLAFEIPETADTESGLDFFMLLMTEEQNPATPSIIKPDQAVLHNRLPSGSERSDGFFPLADNWFLFRSRNIFSEELRRIVLSAPTDVFLAEAFVMSRDQAHSLIDQIPPDHITARTLPPSRARWARSPAEALIPVSSGETGALFMFFDAPDIRAGEPADFTITGEYLVDPGTRQIQPNRWRWHAWPLQFDNFEGDALWVEFRTDPAWDAGLPGFPPDLGVLVNYIVVVE